MTSFFTQKVVILGNSFLLFLLSLAFRSHFTSDFIDRAIAVVVDGIAAQLDLFTKTPLSFLAQLDGTR